MTTEYITLTLKAIPRYFRYCQIPKAQGDTVIITGNGPSLKEAIDQHLPFLQKHPVFSVNFFADTDDYRKVKPLYYGFMDPVFCLQNCFPQVYERREHVFDTIIEATKWDMHMFFPLYPGQMVLEKRFHTPNLHIHICNIFPSFKIPVLRNYVYRTGLLMPPPWNVLVSALYLCLNMGYKNIYLLGAEHSWTQDMIVKDDNIVYISNRYFSETSQHFPWHKNHAGDTWKPHEVFKFLHKTFYSYHLLREYADHRNAKIYNATPESFIDAFDRIPLAELPNGKKTS